MNGKLLTPQDATMPPEFNVMVNVNGEPMPLPMARLIVMNEQTLALTRIAEVLEAWRDQQPWFASQRATEQKLAPVTPLRPEEGA